MGSSKNTPSNINGGNAYEKTFCGIPTSAGVEFLAEVPGTLEQQVRNLNNVAPIQPVGKTFQYSNSNYATLGLIIEIVSGQSYGAYIQQHILNPLQMKHSYYTEQAS